MRRGSRPESLALLFRETHNLKVLFKRLGMHDEEFLKSLMQSKEGAGGLEEQAEDSEAPAEEGKAKVNFKALEAKRAIESQLVTFQT